MLLTILSAFGELGRGRGDRVVTSAHSLLESEVRELVRRRGIDPIAEPDVVARLVEDVVGEYRDRAITSSLPPVGDVGLASRALLDAVAGFGPLQPLLDDPEVEEICTYGRLNGGCAIGGPGHVGQVVIDSSRTDCRIDPNRGSGSKRG